MCFLNFPSFPPSLETWILHFKCYTSKNIFRFSNVVVWSIYVSVHACVCQRAPISSAPVYKGPKKQGSVAIEYLTKLALNKTNQMR